MACLLGASTYFVVAIVHHNTLFSQQLHLEMAQHRHTCATVSLASALVHLRAVQVGGVRLFIHLDVYMPADQQLWRKPEASYDRTTRLRVKGHICT